MQHGRLTIALAIQLLTLLGLCIYSKNVKAIKSRGLAGADPFAIMKAMGHTDMMTTMIYVSLGKSHIREQVEKLNAIQVLRLPDRKTPKVLVELEEPKLRVVPSR